MTGQKLKNKYLNLQAQSKVNFKYEELGRIELTPGQELEQSAEILDL